MSRTSTHLRQAGAALALVLTCIVPVTTAWAQAAITAAPANESSAKAAAQTLDRIIAVVNDEAITATELDARTQIALQQLRRQNIAAPAADVLRRQVLERLIVDRAQIQLARESGVRVDDATVNAAIARIAEQNGANLPEFRERLQKEGISIARFRDDVRDDILMTRLRDREVDSRIQVSEGEIDNFLAEQVGVAAGSVEY